jgi:hypothetical protein
MKNLIIIFVVVSALFGQTQISTGIGSNSDKDIAYQKAIDSAKIEALNMSKVFIKSQLETIKHQSLDSFKNDFKQKVFQKSEGLVSLVEVIKKDFDKNGQIYICNITAKFEVKQSDISNSLEIMKRLDTLAKTKASQNDIENLQKQIDTLKNQIKNQNLTNIINKNSTQIINQIKIKNNISVEVINSTDDMLYFIVGGLIIVIIILIILNARTKNIVVNHIIENPNIKDIAFKTFYFI